MDEIKNEMMSIAKVQVDVQWKQASKEQVDAIQNHMSGITIIQSHLQKKNMQLASKQDLLHNTVVNERCYVLATAISSFDLESGISYTVKLSR